MPTAQLHPRPQNFDKNAIPTNPLPTTLQTPSGLALLELQGSLMSVTDSAETVAALNLGNLSFVDNKAYLFVGKHQRLTGEIKKLGKPIAVIRRRSALDEEEGVSADAEFEVAEIVYYKLLFANRPEPMGGEREEEPAT